MGDSSSDEDLELALPVMSGASVVEIEDDKSLDELAISPFVSPPPQQPSKAAKKTTTARGGGGGGGGRKQPKRPAAAKKADANQMTLTSMFSSATATTAATTTTTPKRGKSPRRMGGLDQLLKDDQEAKEEEKERQRRKEELQRELESKSSEFETSMNDSQELTRRIADVRTYTASAVPTLFESTYFFRSTPLVKLSTDDDAAAGDTRTPPKELLDAVGPTDVQTVEEWDQLLMSGWLEFLLVKRSTPKLIVGEATVMWLFKRVVRSQSAVASAAASSLLWHLLADHSSYLHAKEFIEAFESLATDSDETAESLSSKVMNLCWLCVRLVSLTTGFTGASLEDWKDLLSVLLLILDDPLVSYPANTAGDLTASAVREAILVLVATPVGTLTTVDSVKQMLPTLSFEHDPEHVANLLSLLPSHTVSLRRFVCGVAWTLLLCQQTGEVSAESVCDEILLPAFVDVLHGLKVVEDEGQLFGIARCVSHCVICSGLAKGSKSELVRLYNEIKQCFAKRFSKSDALEAKNESQQVLTTLIHLGAPVLEDNDAVRQSQLTDFTPK